MTESTLVQLLVLREMKNALWKIRLPERMLFAEADTSNRMSASLIQPVLRDKYLDGSRGQKSQRPPVRNSLPQFSGGEICAGHRQRQHSGCNFLPNPFHDL